LAERRLKLVGESRGVEKERPVIGGRTNIERVLGEELLAIAREDQAMVIGGTGPAAYHFRWFGRNRIGLDARRVQDCELQIMCDLPELRDLGLGEGRLLQQKCGDAIEADDG